MRNGKPHPMQKWRAQIGARTLAAASGGSLIFTGAATRKGAAAEARVMADYAVKRLGVPAETVQLELEATNTWENLEWSLPLTAPFDQIAIVSDPLHAARARRYAVRQRPDLETELVASDDYRLFERWWLKVPVTVYETLVRVRDMGFRR